MAKKLFPSFVSFILLLCCACGGENAASGVLSLQEIAEYEALYETSPEDMLDKLSLSEEDVIVREPGDKMTLPEVQGRTMAGQRFLQQLDFSLSDPTGLFGTHFVAELDPSSEDTAKTIKTLYDEAVSLYGEPCTYPGLSGRLAPFVQGEVTQLDPDTSYREDWLVGERSLFKMQVTVRDGRAVMDLEYRWTYGDKEYGGS